MTSDMSTPPWVGRLKRLAVDAQQLVQQVDRMASEEIDQVDFILLRSEPPFGPCGLIEALSVLDVLGDEISRVKK